MQPHSSNTVLPEQTFLTFWQKEVNRWAFNAIYSTLNINIPCNTVKIPRSQNVDCLTIMHFHNPPICLSKSKILYSWDTVLKGFLQGLYYEKYLIFPRKWRAFFALLSNWWEIFTLLKPSFSLPYFTRSALMILKATTTFTRIWKGIIKKDFAFGHFQL